MRGTTRLAIIGCGGMASYHLKQLEEVRNKKAVDFEIVAVCDLKRERAKDFANRAEKFQGKRPLEVADSAKLLDTGDLDAVDIATDHCSHHAIAIPFLKSGVHAMVEKPLAITMRAARNMIDAAKDGGATLAVAENYRRTVAHRALKWIVANGHIGELHMIFSGGVGGAPNWGRDVVMAGTPWRHDKLTSGAGPVLDNGVHEADLFRYFAGDVTQAIGVTKTFEGTRYLRDQKGTVLESVRSTVEDAGFAILQHESGSITLWAPAYWAGHGENSALGKWLYGSKGAVKEDNLILDSGFRMNASSFFLLNAPMEEKEQYFPFRLTDSVAIELYDFLVSIQRGRKPETDGMEGYKAMAISYAVIESSHANAPVDVKEVEDLKVEGYQREINEKLAIA